MAAAARQAVAIHGATAWIIRMGNAAEIATEHARYSIEFVQS
jgi:hypothetical protein